MNYVAAWSGSAWFEVGASSDITAITSTINALAADSTGNIYAAGKFGTTGGIANVAKWNKTTWSVLGGKPGNNITYGQTINALQCDGSGNVYAGGTFLNANEKLIVEKWNGSTWEQAGNGVGDPHLGTMNTLALNTETNTLYAAGTFKNSRFLPYVEELDQSSVLAVNDLDFTASLQDGNAILKWHGERNSHTQSYAVQRSVDARIFISIGNIPATSNSAASGSYSYADVNVSALHVAKIYYRLVQSDQDGHAELSSVATVYLDGKHFAIIAYPNPATNVVLLDVASNLPGAKIKIADAQGKVVYTATHNLLNGQPFKIDVSAFSHGVFFITIDSSDCHQRYKW